ncbi:MAG: 3-isopropylmalate dehydratase small subunit [Halieaceae bacterium]
MEKFIRHSGVTAALLQDNIDTDAIIPSREMKAVSKHGLGAGLFAGWRYLTPGGRDANPDFVLNRSEYAGTSILLSGDNFGCGSSREHAVWALLEFGIRAIIAESFGSIFFNNCVRNGILPLVLKKDEIVTLAAHADSDPATNRLVIDLEKLTVCAGRETYSFTLEPGPRDMLLQGLDPIGQTLLLEPQIATFEVADRERRPWAYPRGN